jgi:hypothetical protein
MKAAAAPSPGMAPGRAPGASSASRWVCAAASLAAAAALGGCSTLPGGQRWGDGATLAPGWERVRTSAVQAARDPWVWAPLAGAAALQIDDWDRRTSDWAREHTPVFGSQRRAEQWSDDLKSASSWAYVATLVLTPSGDDSSEWLLAKAKGVAVQVAATAATSKATSVLKDATGRERPNGSDDLSFPSGHTSASAVRTRLASENLRYIEMGDGTRRALDAGLTALTIGTSWARVEAGWHFPSDTLVGMALGNFLGSFVNGAFLGAGPGDVELALTPTDGGAELRWRWAF